MRKICLISMACLLPGIEALSIAALTVLLICFLVKLAQAADRKGY